MTARVVRFGGAAALFALFAATAPRDARAQACCSGANTVSPARLALGEEVLVAIQTRVAWNAGAFDHRGRYLGPPEGTLDLELEEDLILAAQALDQLQVAVFLPLRQTVRAVPGRSEVGGGMGDLNLSVRWDLRLAGSHDLWPGVALLFGVTLPTGTPAERARRTLATDATGLGALQGSAGLALEQVFAGHYLVNLTGSVSERWPRRVLGIREDLGLTGALSLSLGYLFDRGRGLALFVLHELEGAGRIDGLRIDDTGRKTTSFGASAGLRVADGWRLQASAALLPPISGLARNRLATASFSWTLIYTAF